MPLESLFQFGLLLAAMVTAFAISSIVGMLVARLLARLHQLGGAPDEPGRWPARPDPPHEAPAGQPPADTLGLVNDPVTLTSPRSPAGRQAPAIVRLRAPGHPGRRVGSPQAGDGSFRASD